MFYCIVSYSLRLVNTMMLANAQIAICQVYNETAGFAIKILPLPSKQISSTLKRNAAGNQGFVTNNTDDCDFFAFGQMHVEAGCFYFGDNDKLF